ncbi:DUF3396 domain-containing protein [Archangium gephyra]|nr:DUF3396 domain-containing protein [Archangium gephyra]
MNAPYPRVRVSGPVKSRSWHPDTGGVERIEERLLVRDLFRIAFFIPHDNFDIAAGVSHALDSYLRAVEPHPEARALYTCCDWEPSGLDDRGWDLIRRALRPEVRKYFEDYTPDEAFYPEKESADPYFSVFGDDASGFYFGYHARLPARQPPRGSVSVLRVTLPTEFLEARGPGFIHALVLDMASRLPFASGHAGLALSTMSPVDRQLERLRPAIFRHPGFDIRDASIHDNLGSRLDGIHWLNFIGQPVLGELGGVAGLRPLLHSPSTTVQELDGERAIITLGPSPAAGDLAVGQDLPPYRELARVLERWQEPFPWGWLRREERAHDEEELRRWWRRFLD